MRIFAKRRPQPRPRDRWDHSHCRSPQNPRGKTCYYSPFGFWTS
ncbi:MAG: hypothetical protein QM728_10425 [Gordonia sp. (in: high G+C Gram-positive bacteria)]